MPPASTVNVADSSMSSRTEKRRKKAVVQLGKQCSPVLLHSREFSFGVANAAGISRERRAKQMTSARYTPQNGLAIPCFLIQLVALERSVSGSCQVRVVRQLFLFSFLDRGSLAYKRHPRPLRPPRTRDPGRPPTLVGGASEGPAPLLSFFLSRALRKASRAQRPHTHRLIKPPLWDGPPTGGLQADGPRLGLP